MKLLKLVLLFHLLLICSNCNKVINITSQDHLQLYLCHHDNYTGDTTLLLLDTVYNISGNGSLCILNTNHSLTLQGRITMATIQCIPFTFVNNTHPTIGFAFTGSSNLTLQRVNFIGCGGNLSTLDKEQLDNINSTSSLVHFTQYHAAVLVFSEISHLVMRDVSISQYYGFAVVAVNLPNGILDSVNVNASQGIINIERAGNNRFGYSVGCGVLLLYKNSMRISSTVNQYEVLITRSEFIYNYEYIIYHKFTCATNFYNSYNHKNCSNPVINAAGLTILYTQNDNTARVNISRCTFKDNIGSTAGAMMVLHLNTNKHSQTVIYNESVFRSNANVRKCHGSAIVLVMYFNKYTPLNSTSAIHHLLQVIDVTFESSAKTIFFERQQGAVYIAMINVKKLPILLKFTNVTFTDSTASTSGSCMLAASYPLTENYIQILMESVKAYNNDVLGDIPGQYEKSPIRFSQASLFQLLNINVTKVNGLAECPGNFSYNYGTVIEAITSDITLEGHIIFHNNTGINGAAIMLIEDSLIYITKGLQATFTNNRALSSGGAIYALGNIFTQTYCSFQVSFTHSLDNITMLLKGNEATITGNSVYTPNLYNCYIGEEWVNYSKGIDIYKKIFPNGINDISTTPVNLTICYSPNYTQNIIHDVYPGETFNISVAAVDAAGNHSYSIVTITPVNKKCTKFTHINWWLSERDKTQALRETDDCTLINVTIHTNDCSTLDKHDGALLFTIPELRGSTVLDVKLKSCPPGFKLDNKKGSCVCSHVLSPKFLGIVGYTPNCSINTKTFNRPTETSWVGSVKHNKTSLFLLSLHCPYGYCNSDYNLSIFYYRSDGTFEIMSKDFSTKSLLCDKNREGILCSNCSTVNGINYSVVFGSRECRQCSNWWLWTLILYAAAGPLLIYLLYVLKLTLTTGTFNGIIFYVQVASIGLLDILSIKDMQCSWGTYFSTEVSVFFLSTLNLNLGFPLCFYNGMSELRKAGFSLLFPLYLLIIVVVLIILSRFSIRISNSIAHYSVQILVTVVHLSFTKLLLTIGDIFTPVQLYCSTMKQATNVWFYNGYVKYGKGEHLVLMIITSVIVGVFLIPYMSIILTGRLLMKSNKIREYLRPIYEAIHAPYKYNKQYWFTARQLLLIFLYILYTTYRGRDLLLPFSIALPIYFLFVTVQAHLRPFKNKIINLLDLSVMINYGIIVCTNWYFINEDQYCISGILNITFVYIVMFTFSVVVFYHIVLVTGQQARFIGYINVVLNSMKKMTRYFKNSQPVSHHRHFREDLDSSFFDDSYSEYREPLISP